MASLVIEEGGDDTQAIAALLHDVLEDTETTPAEMRSLFGQAVGDIVEACTDSAETPRPPWRSRKESYLTHLPHLPRDALLVSVADKVHNARSILMDLRSGGLAMFERFTGGRDGTLWYYESLVAAYRSIDGFHPRLLEELERTVRAIQSLTEEF